MSLVRLSVSDVAVLVPRDVSRCDAWIDQVVWALLAGRWHLFVERF